jgi:hypothetical protein
MSFRRMGHFWGRKSAFGKAVAGEEAKVRGCTREEVFDLWDEQFDDEESDVSRRSHTYGSSDDTWLSSKELLGDNEEKVNRIGKRVTYIVLIAIACLVWGLYAYVRYYNIRF